MITNEIGLNAGKVWNLLNELGELSHKVAQKKLNLKSADYYMAVGWLAREGKICHFEKDDEIKVCLK
jgi:hypothetical protein